MKRNDRIFEIEQMLRDLDRELNEQFEIHTALLGNFLLALYIADYFHKHHRNVEEIGESSPR